MNLVRLCITISAPKSAGETDNGENVLSTTNFKLYFLASLAKPLMSATSNKGLLTDSQYKTLVFVVIEDSTISNFVISTNDVSIPIRGEKFFKNYQDNLYGQEQQEASYKRQPQPVDQAGEETERGSLKSKRGKKSAQSVLNKIEESQNEKNVIKLTEEFVRMQNLMNYTKKTQ